MLVTFTCYELGFEEYALLVPVFTVAGVVVLMIGALSYFLYDPYRVDRRNRKKANRYIVEIEKAALKEVRLKEKAFAKQEKAGEAYPRSRKSVRKSFAQKEEDRTKRRLRGMNGAGSGKRSGRQDVHGGEHGGVRNCRILGS